jgi:hypothetical protein
MSILTTPKPKKIFVPKSSTESPGWQENLKLFYPPVTENTLKMIELYNTKNTNFMGVMISDDPIIKTEMDSLTKTPKQVILSASGDVHSYPIPSESDEVFDRTYPNVITWKNDLKIQPLTEATA